MNTSHPIMLEAYTFRPLFSLSQLPHDARQLSRYLDPHSFIPWISLSQLPHIAHQAPRHLEPSPPTRQDLILLPRNFLDIWHLAHSAQHPLWPPGPSSHVPAKCHRILGKTFLAKVLQRGPIRLTRKVSIMGARLLLKTMQWRGTTPVRVMEGSSGRG